MIPFIKQIISNLIDKNNMENYFCKLCFIILVIIAIIFLIVITLICIIDYKNSIKEHKLKELKKIIKSLKFESISNTNTVYEDDKIKFITSSDQQAKVLITAIEAIKDL